MAYSAGQELSSLAFDKIIGGALDAVVKAQSNASMTTVKFIKEVGFKLNDKGEATEPIYVGFKYPKEIAPYQPAQPAYCALEVVSGGSGYEQSAITAYKIGGAEVKIKVDIGGSGEILSASIIGDSANVAEGEVEITAAGENIVKATIKCVKVQKRDFVAAQTQDMELKVPILTMLPVPFIRIATTDIELNVKINSVENTSSSSEDKSDIGGGATVGYKGFGVTASVNFNASISHQKKSSSTEEVKKEFSLNIKVHAVQDEMPAGISRILDILEESITPRATEKKLATA